MDSIASHFGTAIAVVALALALLGLDRANPPPPCVEAPEPVPSRYAQCVIAAGGECRAFVGDSAPTIAYTDCILLTCAIER